MGAEFLVTEEERHDGGLGVDAIGGFEFVEMCGRENVPDEISY